MIIYNWIIPDVPDERRSTYISSLEEFKTIKQILKCKTNGNKKYWKFVNNKSYKCRVFR